MLSGMLQVASVWCWSMRNKIILILILGILVQCPQIALCDEISVEDAEAVWGLTLDNANDVPTAHNCEMIAEEVNVASNLTSGKTDQEATPVQIMLDDAIILVVDADAVWNLTLDNTTSIGRLVGDPGVMVTKYADTFTYYLLENATDVGRLVGEPGVMVTKYADTFNYYPLQNATDVGRLVGEPGVMVTKYADTFTYYQLENVTDVSHLVGEPGVMVTKYADVFTYEGLTAPLFDFTKPMISDVRVTNITLTSATVNWATNEVADSLVKYGTEPGNYTLQGYDSANLTAHSLNLVGLRSNITYYFVINSTDLNMNSNESVEYNFTTHIESEDNTPPYTSGHDPAKGAVDVPAGTNVVVHVLDDESEVDLSTILMTVEGEVVTPNITGTPADYTLTYDPPVDFEYEQVVNVTIDASDVAGNTMNQDAYSFTTVSKGLQYFDTREGTYPSIRGTHNGTITPSIDITVNTLYTYSCSGTGGHTEYVRIYNATETLATGNWEGYKNGDYQNITLSDQFTLIGGQTYNYTIRTGSYPQIIHAPSKEVTGGTITCTKFTDANGHIYDNWIPAIRLEYK